MHATLKRSQQSGSVGNISGAHMNTKTDVSTEKIAADLKLLVADTEELLRATAGEASEKARSARERIGASLATAKAKLADIEHTVLEKTKYAARATDEYVHENPWQAIGVAAGVGFLLGMLISRR
jgi:hypothetical protein